MKKSIDKCSGPDCACVVAANFRPIKKISGMRIESISLDYGPSIFPGAGIMYVGPAGAPLPAGLAMRTLPPDPLRGRRVG